VEIQTNKSSASPRQSKSSADGGVCQSIHVETCAQHIDCRVHECHACWPHSHLDKGGTAGRHQRNPMRQFNGAKPQKFRMDCFILSDAHNHCIHHVDVHQGKNTLEANMHSDVHSVSKMQKVVLNAVLQTEMHECVDGAQHLVMDNQHQCPQLAALLLKRCDICSTGTSRPGHVGWNKEIFTFTNLFPKAP